MSVGTGFRVLPGPWSLPCLCTHQTASSRDSAPFFPRTSPPPASADTIERVNQVISGFSGDTRAWAVCWLLVCAQRLNKCTCLPMHCLPDFVSSLLRSPLFPLKSITHELRATTPAKAFLPNAGLAISCQPLPAVLNLSKLTS